MMRRPLPGLKAQALAWLALREHSRAELRAKLLAHAQRLARARSEPQAGGDPGEMDAGQAAAAALAAFVTQIDATLDELQAKGLINERRVIESVLHRRAGKLGAQRIQQELQRKGLSDDAVQDAVAQLQATELARAREVWRRKFATAPSPADATARAKQMRFLAARGFAADVVRRVVGARDDDADGG